MKAKEYNLSYEEYDFLGSAYVPEDNLLVKALRNVFEGKTGPDKAPHSLAEVTYAGTLYNCVAFG